MSRFAPFVARLGRRLLPRSLRRQITLALSALGVLITVSNLTAVGALHMSANTTHLLAEERVETLQEAQDLVAGTLLVEREARRMLSADTLDELHVSHTQVIEQLKRLDRIVERLGEASGDISVLSLYQSDQLFRNAAHILAGLRENALRAEEAYSQSIRTHLSAPSTSASEMRILHRLQGATDREEIMLLREQFVREAGARRLAVDDPFAHRSTLAEQNELAHQFYHELEGHSLAMVAAAQMLSTQFTGEYREAVEQVAQTSRATERSVMALLVGSLVLAWLVSRFLLGRHVLARLQRVSEYLRGDAAAARTLRVPVEGDDELGQMARAVERFMEDRRQLYAANRELEAFSYSVAHDLRAPLRAINGFADVLLQSHDRRLDEEGQHCLQVIRRNATRMGELIDDMLKLARVTRGEMTLAQMDMGALTRDAFEEARSVSPERNIVLRLGELPVAFGDHALMRQVLVNLLSNAVKFTGPRSEAVIEVDGCVEGEECSYWVKDNGVGFDMRYVGKLFGVFERLHGTTEFEGTGIGLAIVKRIMERHGGRVWAEGREGEGATFHFALPCNAPRVSFANGSPRT